MTGKSAPIWLSLFVVVAVGLGLYYGSNRWLNDDYEYWGYKFEPVETRGNITFLSFKGDMETLEMIKISDVTSPAADEVILDKIVMFQSLFEKQRVGYRGQHTEYIECPENFRPKYFEKRLKNGILRYFTGFATERFSFGACSDEDVHYQAINAYLYCGNMQTMFDIDYFEALDRSDTGIAFVDKVSCSW